MRPFCHLSANVQHHLPRKFVGINTLLVQLQSVGKRIGGQVTLALSCSRAATAAAGVFVMHEDPTAGQSKHSARDGHIG
jgi:hypothetical protein